MFHAGNTLLICAFTALLYGVIRGLYCRAKHLRAGVKGELVRVMFVLCLAGVLSLTVVPYWAVTPDHKLYIYMPPAQLNLVPLRSILGYFRRYGSNWERTNLWGNILLFAPPGLLLPCIWKPWRKFRYILLFSLAFPFCIEFEQHFIGRSSDIDDLLLNAAGILLGWGLWLLARKLRMKKKEAA